MTSQNQKLHILSKEEQLYQRACNYLPGGISRNIIFRKPYPFYAARASGCYVTDISGVTRVDFANNVASLIHGHAHPAIVSKVIEQISNGTAFTIGTEAEIALAEHMCNRVPGFQKIRFMNSGTEAVMAMIKLARAYTGRHRIAKAEGAYHGSYDYAEVSQTSSPRTWGEIDEPNPVPHVHGCPKGILSDTVVFPFNDTRRTINLLNKYADEIACVVIDPVPHRIGLVPASDEFVSAVYQWTREHGTLLCFDEVISFRINYEGAQADYPIKPDLTSLGKIIGGGFPIGGLAGSNAVMELLNPDSPNYRFPLSGTFSANPVSMTAGHIAMQLYDRQAVEYINDLTAKARLQIAEAADIAGIPACTTGRGSMFKIHFRSNPPTTYREAYEDDQTKKIMNLFIDKMYENNIMMINSCSCVLSTVMTQHEVDMLGEAALNSFRHIKPFMNL